MVNVEVDYGPLNITEDTMLNAYGSVVDEQENDFEEYDESNEVQEIYEPDAIMEQYNTTWHHNAVRYLIYCWAQLRYQFINFPEKKKNLWQQVAHHMIDRGYCYDYQTCESKWRVLKKVYMYNKMHSSKLNGTKQIIVWSYYRDMERAMKDTDDINDEEETITTIGVNDDEDDKLLWTSTSTRELIRLYGKYRNKFSVLKQGGKHLLWDEISQQFKQLGYHYSSYSCNDKWRNLKTTYKKNKLRAAKYGIEHIKWFYYFDMEKVLKTFSEEASEQNNIITVSLNEDNTHSNMKKENLNMRMVENSQNTNLNVTENENNDCEDFANADVWTEAATKSLIKLWGVNRSRLLSTPQGKKHLIWNEISAQLRENGHNYSAPICDRKWRLLKANYLKRREKYKLAGVKNVKWQYYHDLDRLLGIPHGNVTWNMESTMNLINSYDHHKDKFMNAPTGEKVLIWKQISDEMEQNGCYYSPRACDNKWRTLKNRYYKNKLRADRNKKVLWLYYRKIDSILRDADREPNPKDKETPNSEGNNQTYETSEFDEHNYIRTLKSSCMCKAEAINDLKNIFKLRNKEFDQRLNEMEDNLNSRSKVFEELQQQTLEALKRSNELETHKLRLLEKLVSKLPNIL